MEKKKISITNIIITKGLYKISILYTYNTYMYINLDLKKKIKSIFIDDMLYLVSGNIT